MMERQDSAASRSRRAPPQAPNHPAHATVDPLATKYPTQAAALFQTFVDLHYAASWRDMHVFDIVRDENSDTQVFGAHGWALLYGIAPNSDTPQAVLPMSVEQSFDTAMFSSVFAHLPPGVATTHILLAMLSNDSTVVYYKLSSGLVKPVN